jgi:hypothetical protein
VATPGRAAEFAKRTAAALCHRLGADRERPGDTHAKGYQSRLRWVETSAAVARASGQLPYFNQRGK